MIHAAAVSNPAGTGSDQTSAEPRSLTTTVPSEEETGRDREGV